MSVKISIYNPYSRIINFGDGTKELAREPIFNWQITEDDWFYTVKKGDTLRGIASRQYRGTTQLGHRLWWVLADVNGIDDATDISNLAGEQLLIPNIENMDINF